MAKKAYVRNSENTEWVELASATTDLSLLNNANLISPIETYTIDSSTAPASTANLYLDDGAVKYFTVSTTNDFVLNISRNSGGSPTLNSSLSVGKALSAAVIFVNGATARKITSITIDGSSSGLTLKWSNGGAYPSANSNSVMIMTLNIIKTGSGAFTIFASQSRYA